MVLGLGVEAFPGTVFVGHVLELALTAGVAHRAVQWVVAEQQFKGGLAGLRDVRGLGGNDHALGDRGRAGGLKLWDLLNAHQAHAAGGLER